MTEILREIVRHPSAWYGRDLANDSSWIVHLEPAHLAEIAAATQSVARRGLPFAALTRDAFPLPTLGPLLRRWQEEIIDGRGFYVLRGLNARDYSDAEVGMIFWAKGSISATPSPRIPRETSWATSTTTAAATAISTYAATRPAPTCPSIPIRVTSWACSACAAPRAAGCRAW